MALVLVLGIGAAALAARAFQEHSVGRYKPAKGPEVDPGSAPPPTSGPIGS